MARSPAALVAPALLLLAGCGRTLFFPEPAPPCVFDADCPAGLRCVNQRCTHLEGFDASSVSWLGQFGERCDGGQACGSGLCIGGPSGAFCTRACDGGCPGAYACKQVPGLSA